MNAKRTPAEQGDPVSAHVTVHEQPTRHAGSCNACCEPTDTVLVVHLHPTERSTTEVRLCPTCATELRTELGKATR